MAKTTLDPKSTHYGVGGIETLDVMRAKLSPEAFRGYLQGCALKYLCRLGHKDDPARDAEKAAYYAKWLADELGGGDA